VEKRNAMVKKREPLIFIGYCEDMKAYRLFDPIFLKNFSFEEPSVLVKASTPHQILLHPQIVIFTMVLNIFTVFVL
jgi:hypothetical protein